MARTRAAAPIATKTEKRGRNDLWIEMRPLSEFKRARRNPKGHDLPSIGSSLGRFGMVEVPVIDERTDRMVAGHGRVEQLQADKDAGRAPPARVRLRRDGEWLVPVLRGASFKDDREAEAYLLASNQTAISGGWTDDLTALLQDLSKTGDDALVGTGFTDEQITELFASAAASELGSLSGGRTPGDDEIDRLRGEQEDRKTTVNCPKCGTPVVVSVVAKYQQAPFPYFGGKRSVVNLVWRRFGTVKQYIEPFCGSAAILLGAPRPASLEVIGDQNFYVANFWRCIKYQPQRTYEKTDYPVTHVDLDARHRWLTEPGRVDALRASLADPEWPGDAQVAGWWVWGLCAWIGSGWCEGVHTQVPRIDAGVGVHTQVPRIDAGVGVHTQVPFVGHAGRGDLVDVSSAGQGVQSQIPHVSSAGQGVLDWFVYLASRLERTRVIHGDWTRALNHNYGGDSDTAVFLDPPYRAYESLYQKGSNTPVADAVCEWARENAHLRIALCGHRGDYDLPGWEVVEWSRKRLTFGGSGTKDSEAIWFSPACLRPKHDEPIVDDDEPVQEQKPRGRRKGAR